MRKKKKIPTGQVVLHILFLLMVVMYIVPFLMVLSISFTDEVSLVRDGYHLIPRQFSLSAYKMVFSDPTQIFHSYRTTIIFTAASTFLAVLVMGVMAYPLSRPNYRFNRPVSFFVLFTMLFSGGMVPSYLLIVKYLHLNNTIWVYILPGLVSAYNLIIIRTNYKSLPVELIEAAKIDGANKFQAFRRVTLPLIMPAVSICMLTSLTFAFKLFDVIMVFTKGGPANSTVSVAYNIYKEAFVNNRYGMATAKSLVFVVLVLIVTVIQLKVTNREEQNALILR